jgi:2-phospho-L-lactate guanylyltransferase (CobY/MobA/RfbA family)
MYTHAHLVTAPTSARLSLSGPLSLALNTALRSGSRWLFAMGWIGAALSGPAAHAAGNYVLNQKFNNLTTGSTPASPWTVVSTGGGSVTVQQEPSATDQSVRIQKLLTSGTSSLSSTVADQSGRVVFEARVMSRETAGFRATPYIYNSSGTTVASVAFQDGNIRAYIGSTSTVVQAFAINVWYEVRIAVDTTTDLFDLYVDGVMKLHNQALRGATSSVNKVSFYMDGTNTGTFYVDNVRIYTEPPEVLDENFNTMPTASAPTSPWTVVSTGGGSVTVQAVPFLNDRSVKVQKLNASGASSLSTTVASQSGRLAFEAKVMARETAGFKAIPYIYNSNGDTVASVSFQDGNIRTYLGGTSTIVQSFDIDVWYLVRVVIDTNTDTFDLYIDGVRKQHNQSLRTATTSVSTVSFFMDGTNTGTLYVDSVRVYNEAAYIGAAPTPVFDVRSYGATGNGTTKDTTAIQNAINACAGTGGSVLLTNGTFLSGTLTLKNSMTFFIDSSAALLGSPTAADYPTQTPGTGNTQLNNCQRALLYAPSATQCKVDGGGVIDGQGDSFSGAEGTRPILFWSVLSNNVTVQNLYFKKGAVWSLVNMESDQVLINNITLQSNNITHDGIDVVDGEDITVQNCAVSSGDDAMCLKTGVRRGIDTMVVKDSVFRGDGTTGGSNGIKFGTATYGAFRNIVLQDCYVKDVQYAAMALESRQGADVDGVAFRRINFANAGSACFIYLAQQATTHPIGDVPKLGSMNNVSFTDITGWTSFWSNSPHQAALITGHIYNGVTYYITNLSFTNAIVDFEGGRTTVPGSPPEATPNQYPESNMFGDLPPWAYYLRHVSGVTFSGCASVLGNSDVRQKLVTSDVTGLVGTP